MLLAFKCLFRQCRPWQTGLAGGTPAAPFWTLLWFVEDCEACHKRQVADQVERLHRPSFASSVRRGTVLMHAFKKAIIGIDSRRGMAKRLALLHIFSLYKMSWLDCSALAFCLVENLIGSNLPSRKKREIEFLLLPRPLLFLIFSTHFWRAVALSIPSNYNQMSMTGL